MADKLSKVDIFVTDLDGTLFLPDTEDIPAEFFEKIENWREEGKLWIVATGRPDDRLREFIEDWEQVPDFYIVEERYIFSTDSEDEVIPFSDWNQQLQEATRRVEDKFKRLVKPLLDWIDEDNMEVEIENFNFIFEEENQARRGAEILADFLPPPYKPLRNRVHLSVAPREVGKGRCLEEIIDRIGRSHHQLLCLGDSANDLDMLDGRYGYLSETVANAEKKIKEAVKKNDGRITRGEGGTGPVETLGRLLEAGRMDR